MAGVCVEQGWHDGMGRSEAPSWALSLVSSSRNTPGRQLIIDTITKLGPAIEASLGWGTVQNNIKFHIGEIHNPHFYVYLNNIKQKSKYSSKISC